MQTTLTGRRGVIALLLMLAVGALALVATSAGTSAAGVELESATVEQALPDAAAISATPDHCGGAGDLALIQATDSGVTSLQPLPAYPGGGRCWLDLCTVWFGGRVWYYVCLVCD